MQKSFQLSSEPWLEQMQFFFYLLGKRYRIFFPNHGDDQFKTRKKRKTNYRVLKKNLTQYKLLLKFCS